MIQVLQPFKVRDRHSTGIQVHVLKQTTAGDEEKHSGPGAGSPGGVTDRYDQDVSLQEDSVGLGRGGTVGTFGDDLRRKGSGPAERERQRT